MCEYNVFRKSLDERKTYLSIEHFRTLNARNEREYSCKNVETVRKMKDTSNLDAIRQ